MFKMKASKGGEGGQFEKPPAGNHPAALVAIVDMGTQKQEYQGEVKWQRRAFLVWELTQEVMSGSTQKHVIGIDLTLSLTDKSKLRKWIEARSGKPIPDGGEYDITSELGQPCLLNVVEKNGYPKIDGVSAMPRGIPVTAPSRKPFAWSLEEYQEGTPIVLPDWIPWLYGRPLADWIAECKELTNGGESRPRANVTPPSKPTNGKPPSAPPSKVVKYWVDMGDAEPKVMTAKQISEHLQAANIDPSELQVAVDGGEWQTAADFGISAELPF